MMRPASRQSGVPILLVIFAAFTLLLPSIGCGDPSETKPESSPVTSGDTQAANTSAAQNDGGTEETRKSASNSPEVAENQETISCLFESEELILDQTRRLKILSKSIANLQLPGGSSLDLFSSKVFFLGLDPAKDPHVKGTLPGLDIEIYDWDVSKTARRVPRDRLSLWKGLLGRVHYFEMAKFYFVRGSFPDPKDRSRWSSEVNFEGVATTSDGGKIWVKAKQHVVWGKEPGQVVTKPEWRIHRWETKSFRTYERKETLYTEVLDGVIPDPKLRKRLRESMHEKLILEYAFNPDFVAPHKYFSPVSFDRHPGLSVVDIDRDGFDDLYIMARWGKNILLHNQGDGTFEDLAPKLGLDYEDNCSGAIFADFDNDGDVDCFLGRTLERTLYLVNENGRFVDRSSLVSVELPYLISAISAADYNQDGLLDVYFSTYAAGTILEEVRLHGLIDRGMDATTTNLSEEVLKGFEEGKYLVEFLPEDQSKEVFSRASASHLFMDATGPPNVLIVNEGGGKFALSPQAKQVQAWHNTLQSTWADIDSDGDPDLYVANDYAPNNLYRNDGGTFVDATEETGTADIGFGMGASFGDFDNNGTQDLYVSNMYSKAGRRITDQFPDIDSRMPQMARGNSLFSNPGPKGGQFTKLSGTEEPALMVENGGWAWGGQFLDVDNDGHLDVFCTSGNFSTPKGVEVAYDL